MRPNWRVSTWAVQPAVACADNGESETVHLSRKIKQTKEAVDVNAGIASLYGALPASAICTRSTSVSYLRANPIGISTHAKMRYYISLTS